MSDSKVDPPKKDDPPAQLDVGGAKLLVPFFIIPLVIVIASVGVFLLFGQLAQRELTALEHLDRMKSTRSVHKRWQSAYALSGLLSRGDFGEERAQLEEEIGTLLKESSKDETQLRQYLILSLSQVGSLKSLPLLQKEFAREPSDEVKIFILWSLGRIGSPEAASFLRPFLESDDPGYRKTSAFALGTVGNLAEDGKALKNLLEDPVSDVRWNAALALANLGDDSGEGILLSLLDRDQLQNATPNLRPNERSQIILSAVNAVGKLDLESAIEPLKNLEAKASDVAVRQASRNALAKIQAEKGS